MENSQFKELLTEFQLLPLVANSNKGCPCFLVIAILRLLLTANT